MTSGQQIASIPDCKNSHPDDYKHILKHLKPYP